MESTKKFLRYLVLIFIASLIFPTMASAETWLIAYSSWQGQLIKASGEPPGPMAFYGSVSSGQNTESVNATVYVIEDRFVSMQLFFEDGNNCTVSARKNLQRVDGTMVCSNGGGNIPFHAVISNSDKKKSS